MKSGVYIARPLILVVMAMSSVSVLANDAAKDQAKKVQQMQRKFSQEKASLEGQLREANGKLETSGKQAEEATARSIVLGGKAKRLEEENRKLNEALAETRKKLEEENASLSSEGRKLRNELNAQKISTSACEARSAQLYQYSDELLGLYVGKGTFSGALQAEPFTGIKRVEVENVYEDYREKLDQLKATPVATGK